MIDSRSFDHSLFPLGDLDRPLSSLMGWLPPLVSKDNTNKTALTPPTIIAFYIWPPRTHPTAAIALPILASILPNPRC